MISYMPPCQLTRHLVHNTFLRRRLLPRVRRKNRGRNVIGDQDIAIALEKIVKIEWGLVAEAAEGVY